MKERMEFIPALREKLTKDLEAQGLAPEIITESLRKWDDGEMPATPWESGCFGVFEHVQASIEGMQG